MTFSKRDGKGNDMYRVYKPRIEYIPLMEHSLYVFLEKGIYTMYTMHGIYSFWIAYIPYTFYLTYL